MTAFEMYLFTRVGKIIDVSQECSCSVSERIGNYYD